jgi:hypothetical protein
MLIGFLVGIRQARLACAGFEQEPARRREIGNPFVVASSLRHPSSRQA